MSLTSVELDVLRPGDWPAVASIYEEGIRMGNATFVISVPAWEEWDGAHLAGQRLVARVGDGILGWAALAPVSPRPAYRGVADVSVYVAHEAQGKGTGRALLCALIARSEEAGIWTLQAGIFPENRASLELHERRGFRTVGVRDRLGKLDGAWRDVVLLSGEG
ncbi:MAG: N-acetyltransferase family protein, partial [Actinomycetota bacterium]|nr:N-acetyltransferase family protein [Actinomycetota bacterium]